MNSEDLKYIKETQKNLLEFSTLPQSEIEDSQREIQCDVVDLMDILRDYGWKGYNIQKFENISFYSNTQKNLFLKIDFNTNTFDISNDKRILDCDNQNSIFTELIPQLLIYHQK